MNEFDSIFNMSFDNGEQAEQQVQQQPQQQAQVQQAQPQQQTQTIMSGTPLTKAQKEKLAMNNTSNTQANTQTNAQPVFKDFSKNTTEQNMFLLNPKRNYTDDEWNDREDIYIAECNKIMIDGSSLTPNDVSVAAGRIALLLTPLRIDNVFAQQALEKYSNQLKIQEKILYNKVKANVTVKLTVDEIKGSVTQSIVDNPYNGTKYNLYELVERANHRVIFTNGIIETLKDKKDLLITHSGILKLESGVGSFTPNVPNDNYINQVSN